MNPISVAPRRKFRRARTQLPTSFSHWGFPVDDQAGPGSHNLPGLIGKRSSRYENQPNISFSKGSKHLEKQYISRSHEREALGRESPGPGANQFWELKFGAAAPRVAIGTGKARYFECFETMKNRSPGPIYHYGDSGATQHKTAGHGFGTGPQRLPTSKDLMQSPSPGVYDDLKPKSALSASFKGKERGHIYSRNLETFIRGRDSPGPVYYPLTEKLGRSFRFPSLGHDSALRNQDIEKSATPGPGSYSRDKKEKEFRTHSNKGSFGKSERRFDPRRGKE